MFDAAFAFTLIQHNAFSGKNQKGEYIFQFATSVKKRYLVYVEEYPYYVFVPKFFPANERNNPNRFSLLTNEYKGGRIIRTVINIMLFIYEKNPNSSFAWMGVATSMKSKIEGRSLTQRYRIYKNVMLNFFDTRNWFHYDDYVTSPYLLINKKEKDIEQFLQNIIRMFTSIYPDLEIVEP